METYTSEQVATEFRRIIWVFRMNNSLKKLCLLLHKWCAHPLMPNYVWQTQQQILLCSSALACQHGSLCSSVFCESSMVLHADQDVRGTRYRVWRSTWRGGSDNNGLLLSLSLVLLWQWMSLTTIWELKLFFRLSPLHSLCIPCCNIHKSMQIPS